jgi:sugar O-acyltransferase (sialic acid O-acetyltransferase NeuD family)
MGDQDKVLVLGAGGHAKVAISTLVQIGYSIEGLFDDDEQKHGYSLLDIKVLGNLKDAQEHSCRQGIIAIGENSVRRDISNTMMNIEWITVIHPEAYVDSTASLGKGTLVVTGAVIQTDAVIGKHTIINTGATVDHDCVVGDFTHIAPGSHVAGGVSVGEGVLLGIGSVVIPGIHIGDWSVIGAGSVVIHDVPEHSVVVGVPGRIIRSTK